jgi:hypothetical protein
VAEQGKGVLTFHSVGRSLKPAAGLREVLALGIGLAVDVGPFAVAALSVVTVGDLSLEPQANASSGGGDGGVGAKVREDGGSVETQGGAPLGTTEAEVPSVTTVVEIDATEGVGGKEGEAQPLHVVNAIPNQSVGEGVGHVVALVNRAGGEAELAVAVLDIGGLVVGGTGSGSELGDHPLVVGMELGRPNGGGPGHGETGAGIHLRINVPSRTSPPGDDTGWGVCTSPPGLEDRAY